MRNLFERLLMFYDLTPLHRELFIDMLLLLRLRFICSKMIQNRNKDFLNFFFQNDSEEVTFVTKI